jgi:(1->4)-alpha-D-glucan 1-alpha-D-glucosylmutase
MGVGGADNVWWLDVLEWGPQSEFADCFDIEWHPDRRYLDEKLLMPFLGGQYGIELQAGALILKFDADAGSFAVWAYERHKLPICPRHYDRILGNGHPELERLGDAFANLPVSRRNFSARVAGLKSKLARLVADDPAASAAVAAAIGILNGEVGALTTWNALDQLIQDQYWRPAHFRVAADDINYRRFFNINDLAGIRMETPEVFDQTHGLAFRLIESGVLNGLRLDHIDGLFDPKAYCLKLRKMAPRPI